jgi:hypothetical protein
VAFLLRKYNFFLLGKLKFLVVRALFQWTSCLYLAAVFFKYFFGGLKCVCHSFPYIAHFVFLGDAWIRAQRAAVASRCATNLATYLPPNWPPISLNLATPLPMATDLSVCSQRHRTLKSLHSLKSHSYLTHDWKLLFQFSRACGIPQIIFVFHKC